MAWRFRASKYKNATPVLPKREFWIREVDVYAPQSAGTPITASAALMAFVVKNRGGGSVGVLPVDYAGRVDHGQPLLAAHSDYVTDMTFSPFDDGLLATGSADCTVRVWSVPEQGVTSELDPELTFSTDDRRVENILFHPTADCLLAAAFGTTVRLYDILHQRQLYSTNCHEDQVQSITWRGDGTCMASTCRDGVLRVLEPRTDHVAVQVTGCTGARGDSWVTWLGCTDMLVTSGFDQNRQRQLTLRDVRRLDQPLRTVTSESGIGVQIPLFDADTNLLFLVGKGDTTISLMEVTGKEPFFIDGLKHVGDQTKGACLVPKRGLDVMKAEVNRLLQMTSNCIIPITYQVPRKTYREFHSDLFPDTVGGDPGLSAAQWWKGADRAPRKISLDPTKVVITSLLKRRGKLEDRTEVPLQPEETASAASPAPISGNSKTTDIRPKPPIALRPVCVPAVDRTAAVDQLISSCQSSSEPAVGTAAPWRRPREQPDVTVSKPVVPPTAAASNGGAGETEVVVLRKTAESSTTSTSSDTTNSATKRQSVNSSFRRVSKCRFMKATPAHKTGQFDNLKNLNKSTTNECDGIHANARFAAILLAGAGGKVAMIDLTRPGRLPDGVTPCLLNGTKVMDFRFDPFDDHRLAVGCDDGCVRVWRVPADGLTDQSNEPESVLTAHKEKVYTLAYHPLADGVLATAAQDRRLIIWDRSSPQLEMDAHPDQVFSMAWSPCGRFLATLCKDGQLRVFEPRAGPAALRSGDSHRGPRGGRLVWVLHGQYIITTGFDRSSERQIFLYSAGDLSKPVTSLSLDVSPSILMCHYDQDTSSIFLTAKGDTSILGYEVSTDYPHLFPLTPYRTKECHQGAAFQPKSVLDVRRVEFARCIRLLPTALVPVSFCVPRVKASLFQDDLFPPTRVSWQSVLAASEWLQGTDRPARLLDLCPEDMVPLSREKQANNGGVTGSTAGKGAKPSGNPALAAVSHGVAINGNAINGHVTSSFAPKPDMKKAQEVEASISKRMDTNFCLEQDQMEGVAEEEWDE